MALTPLATELWVLSTTQRVCPQGFLAPVVIEKRWDLGLPLAFLGLSLRLLTAL